MFTHPNYTWEQWLKIARRLPLPFGYSPALETAYIRPCINGGECASINYLNSYKERGWPTDNVDIKPCSYLYWFTLYPETETGKANMVYRVCTGCHKPMSSTDAIRLNHLLGFKEPKRVVAAIDLGDFDFL